MTTADGFGTKAWENGKVVFYVDYKNKKQLIMQALQRI
jgi:ribosomal protein L23